MSEIAPGQRFRDAKPTLFDRTLPDWVVADVFIGTDGVEYARVYSASDSHERKTLSTAILKDRRRFTRVQAESAA